VEILEERRASRSAPKVVALLALNDRVDMTAFVTNFAEAAGVADPAAVARAVAEFPDRPVTFEVARHRHRLSFLATRADSPLAALETIKVADTLLVIAPAGEKHEDDFDDAMDDVHGVHGGSGSTAVHLKKDLGASAEPSDSVAATLHVLRAQGFPSSITVAMVGLDSVPQKRRNATRNALTSTVMRALQIPNDRAKAVPADTRAERLDAVRTVCEQRAVPPHWRSSRAYVLAERCSFEMEKAPETVGPAPAFESVGSQTATVFVEGYVRGAALVADQLVHLPGIGDFPVTRVELAEDPVGGRDDGRRRGDASMGDASPGTTTILAVPTEHADRPTRENVPDVMAGEQTWPTEAEMAEAEADASGPKKPKGWSDYQAAWIPDAGLDADEDDDDDSDEGDAAMTCRDDENGHDRDFDDDASVSDEEWVNTGDGAGEYGSDVDEETLKNLNDAQRDSVKRSTLRDAEEEELDFPDETDTPIHVPARERFARYRGLKSFRSSPWDPKDQLPAEYGRVFAFENYKRAAKRAHEAAYVQRCAPEAVEVGTYARLVVEGVPKIAAEALLDGSGAYAPTATAAGASGEGGTVGSKGVGPAWSGWCGGAGPVVLSSLLQHESKLTVMHYGVTKSSAYDAPLKSKTPLWFHVGFRRERASPIFSTDSMGDKHKFERFLHARRPSVASVYGPVTYGAAPVLGFKERIDFAKDGAGGANPTMSVTLALSGSVRKADPDRIVLKRIILTGVPFKTHKSKAVVRFMFYNPEDIRWFKPLELWTKYGMRGKIKDAIGTHGHMKCLFNGVIQQRDTICATMYKRVYPKFLFA
jgi:pre-rRNA-processing protein TSR1